MQAEFSEADAEAKLADVRGNPVDSQSLQRLR